ncbi:hypothetical protein P43SY_002707 [Pythium insidiosum]|uniref:C2 domain-containing protein n=1 Tax=Pythium insidiosum TaxID=114742 RepID=A0AAD5MAE0_PYTIN|nr:hypothetical protein P43SY_002707 [Pythium insidiosum]
MASTSPSSGTPSSLGWNALPVATHRSVASIQQLSAFGMRNVALAALRSGQLVDLYFKLVLDGHVVYVSEIARDTVNPVWMPFQLDEHVHDEEPGESLGNMYCGTCFDIIVMRVCDGNTRGPSTLTRISSGRRGFHTTDDLDSDSTDEPKELLGLLEEEEKEEDSSGSALAPIFPDTCGGGVFEEEVFRFSFNIRELDPLPTGVVDTPSLPFNTCLLDFNGRTHVRREVIELLVDGGVISTKHSRRKGSAIQLKDYSLHDGVDKLERIRSLRRHVEEVTKTNRSLQQQIQTRLVGVQRIVEQDQLRADARERLQRLRREIADTRETIARVRSAMHDEKRTFETDIHIPKALLSTMQMGMRYKDEKQGILERRHEVLRAAHKIRSRQAMLVQDLGRVYPIEYDGVGDHSIRGIRITKADLTIGGRADEEQLSTALGYIAHLVFMLSKYLHVNLRYKVVPYSSRSYMKDEINDPHGEYPLYRKGVEKERFERAIHFLRRNVEQLLFARGLDPTKDATILDKLKNLMDAEALWLNKDREAGAASAVGSR